MSKGKEDVWECGWMGGVECGRSGVVESWNVE